MKIEMLEGTSGRGIKLPRFNLNCHCLNHDCTKCYGKRKDGTIDRSSYMTPTCYASPCGITTPRLHPLGRDAQGRPLYETANGMVFVDVNCGIGDRHICTVTPDGEPDCDVEFDYMIEEK